MKTSDVSNLLRKASKILNLFGDIPLEDALDKIYAITKDNVGELENDNKLKKYTTTLDLSAVINDDLIENMSRMNGDELADFLQSSHIFKSKESFRYLADKLSLTSSKRHNIETLKHFIITYFERGRMDDILRNDRKQND